MDSSIFTYEHFMDLTTALGGGVVALLSLWAGRKIKAAQLRGQEVENEHTKIDSMFDVLKTYKEQLALLTESSRLAETRYSEENRLLRQELINLRASSQTEVENLRREFRVLEEESRTYRKNSLAQIELLTEENHRLKAEIEGLKTLYGIPRRRATDNLVENNEVES